MHSEFENQLEKMYAYTQPLHHKQDMTKDQFLSRVKLVFLLLDWLPNQG